MCKRKTIEYEAICNQQSQEAEESTTVSDDQNTRGNAVFEDTLGIEDGMVSSDGKNQLQPESAWAGYSCWENSRGERPKRTEPRAHPNGLLS